MAVSAAAMKAALLFTHQHIQNSSSNELSLSQQNKDPSCHRERRVPSPGLPAVGWADVGMIMPSPRLMSLFQMSQKPPDCYCLIPILFTLCVELKDKRLWMDDADFFLFIYLFIALI